MENSYGIASLWAQSDLVIKSVAGILLVMSICTWSILITKWVNNAKLKKAAGQVKQFWLAKNTSEGLQKIKTSADFNPFVNLVNSGMLAKTQHQANAAALTQTLPLSDWITSSLQMSLEETNELLQKGLTTLASIGATAPFIGLFGTVWGIYHALINIGTSGSVSIDQLAGPVGEALVMTAFGLFVAIPAVLIYNALVRSNRQLASRLNHFSVQLNGYLVLGSLSDKHSETAQPQD